MTDSTFTRSDFRNLVQKHVLNAVTESLMDNDLPWHAAAPFLESARDFCRSDFRQGARIRIHTVQAQGEQWVDAEEAFLGISVADREDGSEWLSETYWISDLAVGDGDPEEVRRVVAALERSLAKLREWLAEQEEGGTDQAEPPSDPT